MSYYVAQDGRIFRDNRDGSRTWNYGHLWERWTDPDLNQPLVHLHQNLCYFMTSDQIPVFCSPFKWDEINDVHANTTQWARRVIGRAVQWAQNKSRTFIVSWDDRQNGSQVEQYRIVWNREGYQVFYKIKNEELELELSNPRYTRLPRSSNANEPIFFETGFLYDVVGSSEYREIFIPAIPTPAFITRDDRLAALGLCMNEPMPEDAVNPSDLQIIYQSLDGQIFKINKANLSVERLSEGAVWEHTSVRFEQQFANQFWGTAEKQTVIFPDVWSLHYNETTADWSVGAGPHKDQKNFFQVAGPEFKALTERLDAKILKEGTTKTAQAPAEQKGKQRSPEEKKLPAQNAATARVNQQDRVPEQPKLLAKNAGNNASAKMEQQPEILVDVSQRIERTKLNKALELAESTAKRVDHWWLLGLGKAKRIREAKSRIEAYSRQDPDLQSISAGKLIQDQGLDSAMGEHRWKFFSKRGEKAKSLQELEAIVPELVTPPRK